MLTKIKIFFICPITGFPKNIILETISTSKNFSETPLIKCKIDKNIINNHIKLKIKLGKFQAVSEFDFSIKA